MESSDYFNSYEDLEIHKLMLEDAARTNAYKDSILQNKEYFNGKVVMDVGCGTGVLSIFCAQAGASKIYAVEASSLAILANEIVKENNYENVIQVIHNRVEDVTLPENVKVDAIVSEWMGFYLLHEGMLDSVMYARDKFLKEGGEMFPTSATIYAAPCSLPSFNQWEDFNGIKMESFGQNLRLSKSTKPEIMLVPPEDIIGDAVALAWIDLKEDQPSDLDTFSIKHVVGVNKGNATYDGICLWFACTFPNLSKTNEGTCVMLDTGPCFEPTHWKQTVIVLPEKHKLEMNEPIAFRLVLSRDPSNKRRYTLQLQMEDPELVDHPMPCSCDYTKCIVLKTYINGHLTE